jgi:hypothetical protein
MAADQAHARGFQVSLFDRASGFGRKLLIAGSSGLNITHEGTVDEFLECLPGPSSWIEAPLRQFPPRAWLEFIERQLGLETFLGTSGRYFVRDMKASNLVKRWTERLKTQGVALLPSHALSRWEETPSGLLLHFENGAASECDALVLALGGGSYLASGDTQGWIQFLIQSGIAFAPFRAANVGFEVAWKPEFLREALRAPLKNIQFKSALGEMRGELLITEYGLEGTPLYTWGAPGPVEIDLKPDLSLEAILERLTRPRRKTLSAFRVAQRELNLGPAALALLFHHGPEGSRENAERLARLIKRFPLDLQAPRPLSEAISSHGGILASEFADGFQLKRFPQVYCVAEMLNWSAPTGGYLIQTCVSQGFAAAQALALLHPAPGALTLKR